MSTASGHLVVGTFSFLVCFAAWGLISAFAPAYRTQFHLSATQTSLLVTVPVLLGSLARIPMGLLTDTFGARVMFPILLLVSSVAAFLVSRAQTYQELLMTGLLLGLAGSSFAVGVGYVSRWFPPRQQGTALGIYALGNIGQSAAVLLGPVLAASVGREPVIQGTAVLLAVWAAVYMVVARDAPNRPPSRGLAPLFAVLTGEPLAWLLSAFYFLTFGGFVAFSIYLPTLLRDEFNLTLADAGFRTAGFVVVATLLRPAGGALSDRIGGARVLSGVFLGITPFALLMAWPQMAPFTVGALGCAALLGLGNGAVFKLVPQYFPLNTGTVTGLVGAMGGLGGFFPPLLLGVFRDRLGHVLPGYALLSATALLLWWANGRVFLPRQLQAELTAPVVDSRVDEQIRAGLWALMITALVVASIVVGSRNLQNFDPALVIYTFAVIVACWGVVYHYAVWLQKPPTRRFWQRNSELIRALGLRRSLATLSSTAVTHVLGQTFIAQRSRLRWWMHFCLFWGCLTALAITLPLVFGWIHFSSAPDDQMTHITYLFGFPVASFRIRTITSWLLFHGLDISAVLVLAGVALSLWRRLRDAGALALETFSADFFPLILLFAISVTGLALTACTVWFRGAFYGFLAILHAITVVGGLLYLPFGKFFHIFQRPAQLGVKLYQQAGASGPGAVCPRCGDRFASQMQVDDLRAVLPQLGFDYSIQGPAQHWQAVCPACKRRSMAAAQLRAQEESRG